jgi:glycosyltransferase involved in cell wall biosynthesis
MRILICSFDAPLPPPNGQRLQVAELINELRKRHEVRVLALLMPDQLDSPGQTAAMRLVPPPSRRLTGATIRAHARAALRGRPRGLDVMAHRLRGPLREELERFDPHITHVTGGLAALGDELAGRRTMVAPLDAWHLNMDAKVVGAQGLRRLLASANAAAMRRYEATAYKQFGRVVVVSEADAEALRALDPELRVSVITNGVDVERYAADSGQTRDPRLVMFSGVLDYPPNVSAAEFVARRVIPRVRATCPDARLALVGRSPSPTVEALGELENVEVFADVPDMSVWLSRAGVYICPMVSGSGVKNKLLEALANGLPCVATPLATRGTRITPGRDVLVGVDEEELAAHVVELLRNPQAAASLGSAGLRYVVENHSWPAVARAYERVYQDVSAS